MFVLCIPLCLILQVLLKKMKRKGYLPTFEKCEGRVENMLKLGPIIL